MRRERRVDRPTSDQVDARVAAIAARSYGVVSVAELRACGLSADATMTRERAGRLHVLHRSVYAVGHAGIPPEGRMLAAVKACGASAVLSHRAAAWLWGLLPALPVPEVTVVGSGTRVHTGIRVHRTRFLERCDRRTHRGIAVTSPARTLLDCAAVLRGRELRRVVREGVALKLVSVADLAGILSRLAPRRGSGRLAAIVAADPAPTRTVLEDVVLDLILRGGLERPDVNVPRRLEGRLVVPDFRWPAQRLVIEADGAAWHDHKLAREDDAARQALLEAHGDRVIRVTWEQALKRPDQTLARIRAAGAPSADGRVSG